MTFVDCLENYLQNHKAKDLAEMVDCNPCIISKYRDGVEPNPERKALISKIIGFTEGMEKEFQPEIEYVPYKEAAIRLGLTEYSLKCAIRDKAFPFAIVFRGCGDKYMYKIIRKDFEEFIEKHKMPQ